MKIAFITRSLTGGGAERVVSVLANSFVKESTVDQVFVISLIEDKVTYPIDDRIIYLANKSPESNKVRRVIQRYRFLRSTIRKIDPDVIISFCTQINIYSILAMHGMKGKLIISERNDPNNDPEQSYVRKLRDLIYGRSHASAVFQTPDAAEYFRNIIRGSSVIIMNPIKEGLPGRYIGTREHRIVSVARLTHVKNHQMLIKAFATISNKYPDYILEIYGEGPEKEPLTTLIRELGIEEKVFLRGFCADVHEKIVKASCFVLPSNYEGISNSMIEALGLGLPTICTDCPIGGARMTISNGVNGILIPVGDQHALEDSLVSILSDKIFAEKLSNEAVKINDRLSSELISNQWKEFIITVIASEKRSKNGKY